ncbi:MAG: 3-oxoacyl-[acyl-carrier-protein] synthase II [Flavobacteriales bacterium]|jgi:3-oxoacyl-[acyl-carrier-protein] synthase II
MVYIHSTSAISVQAEQNELLPIAFPCPIVAPNYRDCISPANMRRMGNAVKMGVWSALEAGAGKEEPIIVGSGMGCLKDSEKFLGSLRGAPDIVSPTPFIQSTHNTASGQIALNLGNHNYNITHVQNGISFEVALMDGMLWIQGGENAVLVGGVDEKTPLLTEIGEALGLSQKQLNEFSEGATFAKISKEVSGCELLECEVFANREDAIAFASGLNAEMMLVGNSGPVAQELPAFDGEIINFNDYCGLHMSNSAFALHMAFLIITEKTPNLGRPVSICIFNQYLDRSFGVTYCRKH